MAGLRADAAFDPAAAWYDGLAAALVESSQAVDRRFPDHDADVFSTMFDEWCAELKHRHGAAHPSVKEMPRSFYDDPEKWAKRNNYQSFTQWAVQNAQYIIRNMLDTLNSETDGKHTPVKVVTEYVAAHADELLCRGIVELLKTHRSRAAWKELARIKYNNTKK